MRVNYVEMYFRYLIINLKTIMVYDLDYILGIVAMFLKSMANFCLILILYEIVDNINGWTFEQMLFLYGMSTLGYALWHCFFIDIITIPAYIQSGDFDRFLLKPIDPLFQIMMETFDEDGWGELFFGVVVLMISIIKLKIWTLKLLLIPVFCISGCFIYAGISILCSSVAFYTTGNIDLTDNVLDFKEFAKYPTTIFNMGIRFVFTIVIPIGFTAYYPSMLYFGSSSNRIFFPYLAFPISIIFFGVSWWWWHYSLRKYNSSGY